jgi:hypothetical protein
MYNTEAISWYTSYGALPHLVEKTAEHYKQLISVLVAAVRQDGEGNKWDGSYTQTMLAHHAKHL